MSLPAGRLACCDIRSEHGQVHWDRPCELIRASTGLQAPAQGWPWSPLRPYRPPRGPSLGYAVLCGMNEFLFNLLPNYQSTNCKFPPPPHRGAYGVHSTGNLLLRGPCKSAKSTTTTPWPTTALLVQLRTSTLCAQKCEDGAARTVSFPPSRRAASFPLHALQQVALAAAVAVGLERGRGSSSIKIPLLPTHSPGLNDSAVEILITSVTSASAPRLGSWSNRSQPAP